MSKPQDMPSMKDPNRELFDLINEKEWSPATALVENKDPQRTKEAIDVLSFYQNEE